MSLSTASPEIEALQQKVAEVLAATPATDMHTHLFGPHFGDRMLWGVDELMAYHYIQAEALRYEPAPAVPLRQKAGAAPLRHEPGRAEPSEKLFGRFFAMSKAEQAEAAFDRLFVQRSPVSESARGVVATLHALGADTAVRDLDSWRQIYQEHTPQSLTDKVFQVANVREAVMTNDPFDPSETCHWEAIGADRRFLAALRLDGLLMAFYQNVPKLQAMGYAVTPELTPATIAAVQSFLRDSCRRIQPLYMAVSLPPNFDWPNGKSAGGNGAKGNGAGSTGFDGGACPDSPTYQLMQTCVLPVCAELGLPLALMVGVRRAVNPAMHMAGDGMGTCDVLAIERLCAAYPGQKFLVTVLARENQHALCVAARKFKNLFVFGCWWFCNNQSLVIEITKMRLEMLGFSFLPQHSDCRVTEQLIYKWKQSRAAIAVALTEKYAELARGGWQVTEDDMRRDAKQLLGGAFWDFIR